MLSGLMGCLLPSLEEQDTEIKNEIFSLFERINVFVGNKFFLSTLWLILLKNSKNRLSGFKILNKKFESLRNSEIKENKYDLKNKENDSLCNLFNDINLNNNEDSSYFANPSMVINALSKCLEDEDLFIKKTCLDFCIKFIK